MGSGQSWSGDRIIVDYSIIYFLLGPLPVVSFERFSKVRLSHQSCRGRETRVCDQKCILLLSSSLFSCQNLHSGTFAFFLLGCRSRSPCHNHAISSSLPEVLEIYQYDIEDCIKEKRMKINLELRGR